MDERWDDERLATVFRERFGGEAPADLVPATLDRVRAASAGPRISAGWRVAALAAALVIVVGAGFAAVGGRLGPLADSGSGYVVEGPPGLLTFKGDSFAFDFPEEWTYHDASAATTGFASPIGVLGTLPIDPRCGSDRIDINCYHERKLEPRTISIVVSSGILPGDTVLSRPDVENGRTRRVAVAGMPAILDDFGDLGSDDYYAADLVLRWQIAWPTELARFYQFEVNVRGPDVEQQRRQAEAMVASFRFEPPPVPLPTDPDADEAADRVALEAIEKLDRETRHGLGLRDGYGVTWYRCFLGEREISVGPGGDLGRPVAASCSWTVGAAEAGPFWQLDLAMDWAVDGEAGRYEETLWLSADGSVVGRRFGGDPPP